MYETFLPLSKFLSNYFTTIFETLLQMLTKDDIEEFYKHVESLGLKFPGSAIEKATGYNKSNVSKILNRKLPPSEEFLKTYYNKFPKSSKKVSRETIVEEPELDFGSNTTLQAILNLTESNKKLADSHATLADSNAALARSHEKLVKMLQSTVSDQKEKQEADESMFEGVIETLLKVGQSAGTWKTVEDGRKVIRKAVVDSRKAKSEVHK